MKKKVVIIGAGITGLSLGWKLSDKYEVIIVEKEAKIGGMCSSFKQNNFILDYGPHKLYPQKEQVLNEILGLYREDISNLLKIKKKSSLSLKGKFFNYPLQMKEVLTNFNLALGANLFLSYLSSTIKNLGSRQEKEIYEEFLQSKFGKGLYDLVFKENAQKIWGDPKKLSADLAKTRISSPNLINVLINTLTKKKDPTVNAEYFFYPKYSIKDLMDRMEKKIIENKGKILLSSKIKKVKKKKNRVTELQVTTPKNTLNIKPDFLISTAHLKESLDLLGAPINLKSEVNELNFRGLALVYVIIKKEKALNDNWIFFPEKNFIFQRISEQKSFSAFNQPKDKSVIVAEISLRPEILKMSDRELQEKVVGDLQKAGLIRGNEVESSFTLRKDNVYPIYLLGYKRHLNLILKWIDNNATNFITCGRNGLFNYNNMDHCIDMAIKIAEHLKTKESVEDMSKLRKYFETYKIVD